MSDPTTNDTETAQASVVTVNGTTTDWRDEALAALDAWATAHTHDNPLSRDTPRYNAVQTNLQSIRQTLSEV